MPTDFASMLLLVVTSAITFTVARLLSRQRRRGGFAGARCLVLMLRDGAQGARHIYMDGRAIPDAAHRADLPVAHRRQVVGAMHHHHGGERAGVVTTWLGRSSPEPAPECEPEP